MKKIIFLFCFLLPSLSFGMVRIQDIIQGGQGKEGVVSINLKEDYDVSKAKIKFLQDKAIITLPDTFILPIKRVFRPSSPRSSVIRIEAQIKSSESVDVTVYFRGKYLDAIKKTYKIEKENNAILFKYNIVLPIVKNETTKIVENEKSEQKDKIILKKPIVKQKQEESKKATLDIKQFEIKSDKKTFSIWKITKLVVIFLGIFGLIFISIILSRKYFYSSSYSVPNKKGIEEIKDRNLIKIVERKKFSFFKKLYIIEAMNEKFLISESLTKLKLISKLKEQTRDSFSYDDNKENLLMKNRIKNTLKDI